MTGRCHLCQNDKDIIWCKVCEHWFCEECRRRYWSRGLAAVRELVGGRTPNCCGPRKESR
jgi:hypothetical protein